MLNSPLIALAAGLCGVAVGVLLVSDLIRREWPSPRRWAVAVALVAVVVLGASLPGKLHAQLNVLNDQRKAYAGTWESVARERCLNDMGRPDLVESLAFARREIESDARYVVKSSSQSLACLIVNLYPRRPVREADFDPRRDWIVLDGVAPDQVSPDLPAMRDSALDTSRQVTHPPSLTLVRPAGAAP